MSNVDLLPSADSEQRLAQQKLEGLSPAVLLAMSNQVISWQNSRNLISEQNRQHPRSIVNFLSGEIEESREETEKIGLDFDSEAQAKELMDMVVFILGLSTISGYKVSARDVLMTAPKRVGVADSSRVYDRLDMMVGDISLRKERKKEDEVALTELLTTTLSLYASLPNLPHMLQAMRETIRLNRINYPAMYFVLPKKISEDKLADVFAYRKAVCRVLRDEKMIGKEVDPIEHQKNVRRFADIVLDQSLNKERGVAMAKDRILELRKV